MILSYESFINEKLSVGDNEFDTMNDVQQMIMLIINGMLHYNHHLECEVKKKNNELIVTIGRKMHDWNKKDPETISIIRSMIKTIDAFPDIRKFINWKNNTNVIQINSVA